MITNKDIRVENGSLIINGDPYPLDGQSPEAIMNIVEDNSDTTPTASSTNPVTSGGVKTYVDDLIKTQYLETNISTLSGNSRTAIEIALTIPTGYAALGITSAFTSSSNVAIVGYFVNSNTGKLTLVCANLSESTVSGITVAATCIYVRQ